jgi:hypothetical protein
VRRSPIDRYKEVVEASVLQLAQAAHEDEHEIDKNAEAESKD